MRAGEVAVPSGYRLLSFDRLDSTNAEALRRAAEGEPGKLWVTAASQSAGRGRLGRSWESPPGNLYASLLLRLRCPIEIALQLALVAGVAAFDAVASLDRSLREKLKLKWPNDLLLDNAKLGGILLESSGGAAGMTIAIGTGLNLTSHPIDGLKPSTDLAAHGLRVEASGAFEVLARTTDAALGAWNEGLGFPALRRAWEERAIAVGREISVRVDDREETGIYGGIDASGALRLIGDERREKRISAGDVFLR